GVTLRSHPGLRRRVRELPCPFWRGALRQQLRARPLRRPLVGGVAVTVMERTRQHRPWGLALALASTWVAIPAAAQPGWLTKLHTLEALRGDAYVAAQQD